MAKKSARKRTATRSNLKPVKRTVTTSTTFGSLPLVGALTLPKIAALAGAWWLYSKKGAKTLAPGKSVSTTTSNPTDDGGLSPYRTPINMLKPGSPPDVYGQNTPMPDGSTYSGGGADTSASGGSNWNPDSGTFNPSGGGATPTILQTQGGAAGPNVTSNPSILTTRSAPGSSGSSSFPAGRTVLTVGPTATTTPTRLRGLANLGLPPRRGIRWNWR